MASYNTQEYLSSLHKEANVNLEEANSLFVNLSQEQLNWKPAADKWSVAECLQHLNSYSAYYLPKIEKAIKAAKEKGLNEQSNFSDTWLGRFSIKSVKPERIHKKMNSPKHHNHNGKQIPKEVVSTFLNNEKRFLQIIEDSKSVNIRKTKISIEVAQWLKLSLGDFLKFNVTHESRHILQAKNVLEIAR